MRVSITASILLSLLVLGGCGESNVDFLKSQTVPALGYKSLGSVYSGYDYFENVDWKSYEDSGATVVQAYCVYDKANTDLGDSGDDTTPVVIFYYTVDADKGEFSLDGMSVALEENGSLAEKIEVPDDYTYEMLNDFYEDKPIGLLRDMSAFMGEISEDEEY